VNQLIEINSIGRIKFLIEYDLSKSPHENILLEQQVVPKLTYNQELAKIAGYKNITPKQADELAAAGRLVWVAQQQAAQQQAAQQQAIRQQNAANLKTMMSTDPESALRKAMILDPYRDKGKDGTISLPSTDIRRMYQSTSTAEQFSKLWTNWNHETAGKTELAMTIIGFALIASGVGAPIGTGLLIAGTTVGVMDAMKYYNEGDPYMGTMMMALQIIPGGDIIRGLSKYAPKFIPKLPQFQQILRKVGDNKTLTDFEDKVFEEGQKAFNKYLPELSRLMSAAAFRLLKIKLKNMTLGNVMIFLLKVSRISGKGTSFIGKLFLKLLRITVTFDQLWTLMATPESWRMKMRTKSEFSKVLDMLYDGTLSQTIKDGLWEVWTKLWNTDGTPNLEGQEEIKDGLIEVGVEELDSMETGFLADMDSLASIPYDDTEINQWKKYNVDNGKIEDTSSSVTIESILSGKQTIRKGQKGSVVTEIQNMLFYLGYDLGEFGKDKLGVDGDFGDSTQKAVIEFQKDNNLRDKSGVVDKETLSLLKKQYGKS
jgi:peptidoglycan hydrolase-like protein with peptidoglycan-binding domain